MAIDIKVLYTRYGPMVLRRCRGLLKNEERALDAMQDVFVKLIKNQTRLKDTYPSSLLYTMATNTCLNIIRSTKRHPENENDQILLTIACHDDSLQHLVNHDLLNRLFKHVPVSTRDIMVMLYVDHMTLAQTSRIAGLSVSGIRKRVREFKARVKDAKEFQNGI
ncbi:RNA polymerase sigma factor [bacterium]|nr:RNA polymerase sigma factor [bacterium]